MTWAQIRLLALQAMGKSSAAEEEVWNHLSEGYRTVAIDPDVDVPELAAIDDAVVVALGADYVEMASVDFSAFAILDVFNKTEGFAIHPEPGGMTGRRRYLDTTGKPPSGSITHYQRDGSKLYVRNTPSVATTLMVRVRRQIAALSDADLNLSPLTPNQYDWAIVYYAAASYFSIHGAPENSSDGVTGAMVAQGFRDQAKGKILSAQHPRVEEDRPRRESFRLRGYSYMPRTRFGR